jgi:hypothetical protein
MLTTTFYTILFRRETMKKLLGILVLVLVACMAVTAFAEEPKSIAAKEGQLYNWGDKDFITKVGDHTIIQPEIDSQEPTCTEYGWCEYDCTDEHAGKHTHIIRFFPLGHDWASLHDWDRLDWGNVIKAPTCQEEGIAQDVCLVCGETRDVFRTIDKINHEYDDEHYKIHKAPTCTATGLGQHTCIFCGEPLKGEKEADMVVLPMIPHTFTEWNITKYSTCEEYGAAERACLVCGMHQILADDGNDKHDIYENGKRLLDIVEGVAKLNPKYPADPEDKEFDTESEYQTWESKIDYEYFYAEKWLEDCYTRVITYACPYCYNEEDPDASFHKPFTVTLKAPITISHVWNKIPEAFYDEETGEGLSLAPTCLEPGYYIYLCKYDLDVAQDGEEERHGHDGIIAGSSYEEVLKQGVTFTGTDDYTGKTVSKLDHQVKIEKIAPLGHDWSPWNVERTYTKDGKKYALDVRTCALCGANEENVRELLPEDGKNGLVKDEDGNWYYYEDDEVVTDTKIVGLDEGDFWIVEGQLAADANGLTYCPDHVFYFLSQGQIQRVSQVVEFKGEWFKVVNGELDLNANGLYDYDGGKFVFAAGRLINTVNGLWKNPADGEWYFLAQGQLQAKTGVAEYDGEFFLLKDGKLDTAYAGTYDYDGATFNVVNGQLYEMAE